MKGLFTIMHKKKEHSERKNHLHNKGQLLPIIILSVLVVILAVCVILLLINSNNTASGGNNVGPGSSNDKPSNGNTEASIETGNTDVGGSTTTMTIETPYCQMKYPAQYKDYLEIKEFNENGIYTKHFSCMLSSGQYSLFAVHFGEGASGDFFGYLIEGEDKISVYIECYTNTETAFLSEEENMIYYYMMDGINEIARSISETSGYATH